jgi:hypothetical protein
MKHRNEYPKAQVSHEGLRAKLERMQEMIRNGEELPSIVIPRSQHGVTNDDWDSIRYQAFRD